MSDPSVIDSALDKLKERYAGPASTIAARATELSQTVQTNAVNLSATVQKSAGDLTAKFKENSILFKDPKPPEHTATMTDHPLLTERGLTFLEKGSLLLNSPTKATVESLIQDSHNTRDERYYVRGYDKAIHKEPNPSTVMLDHVLANAKPEEKQGLVNHGISVAAGTGRKVHADEVVKDLYVLARHGGDLNRAVIATDDPHFVARNARATVDSGQKLTNESVQHIMKNQDHSRSLLVPNVAGNLDGFNLVPHLLEGSDGKNFGSSVRLSHIVPFETKSPLALAIASDPKGQAFDDLLAKGAKANQAELFAAAAVGKDAPAGIQKLKDSGYDINAKTPEGMTAAQLVAGIPVERGYGSADKDKFKLGALGQLQEGGASAKDIRSAEASITDGPASAVKMAGPVKTLGM